MRRASSRTGPEATRHGPEAAAPAARTSPSSVRSGPSVTGSAYKHQVVPCTTSWDMSSGSWSVRRPTHSVPAPRADGRGPWRRPCRRGPTISTASSGPNRPVTADHAGRSSERAPSVRAWLGPLVDHERARRRRGRRRSTACGPRGGGAGPGTRCPRRARRPRRRPGRRVGSASAMTVSTPDQVAILAAASFEAIPPLPTSLPGPPAISSRCWSISTTSSMSEASATSGDRR